MSATDRPEARTLRRGLEGHAKAVVTEDMLAPAVGSGTVAVYATPCLAALMEQAAVACVEGHLAAGEAGLGTRTDTTPPAPAVPGQAVSARATLTEIDGRKLTIAIEAWTPAGSIGTATHTRVVIDVARFLGRLAAR